MASNFVPKEAIRTLTLLEVPAKELERFVQFQARLDEVRSTWSPENDSFLSALRGFQASTNDPTFDAVNWFQEYWLTLEEVEAVMQSYGFELASGHFMYPTVRALLKMLSQDEPDLVPIAARRRWDTLLATHEGDYLSALVDLGYTDVQNPQASAGA